ncbi:MAG: hypothetical protein DVB27_09895 [Verrucomicrobia bacterium]|nr:MAG: hypothetical protein DVB27_09895 [Verrucomicrobiota bacterium]
MLRTAFLILGVLLAALPARAQQSPTAELVAPVEVTSIPPAPASHVLDQADVILPDVEVKMSARLLAARLQGVAVYVATVSSLRVPPSQQAEALEKLAGKYCAAWNPKQVGALLLFDDEGGLMTVVTSKEAEERFTAFLLEKEFREGLAKIPGDVISRVKLERSGIIVADTLARLQSEAAKGDRTKRIGNLVMGLLAVLGIGLAILSALSGPKATAAQE